MNGTYNFRPDRPKYDETWDPLKVLQYFSTINTKELSLDSLSQKLITLMLLVTGQRMQTLSLIRVENISITEELIEIKIPDKLKTSKKNRRQPILRLPFYSEDKNICAASTLLRYLEITSPLRTSNGKLFIVSKKTS